MSTQAMNFDKDVRGEAERIYGVHLLSPEQIKREIAKLHTRLKHAKKKMEQASLRRAELDPHHSRARITSANARHHAAAEDYARLEGYIQYLKERSSTEPRDGEVFDPNKPSFDRLFDGSNAHLI